MTSMKRHEVKDLSVGRDARGVTRYRQHVLAATLPDLCPDSKHPSDSAVSLLSVRHSGVLDSLLFNSLEETSVDSLEEMDKKSADEKDDMKENADCSFTVHSQVEEEPRQNNECNASSYTNKSCTAPDHMTTQDVDPEETIHVDPSPEPGETTSDEEHQHNVESLVEQIEINYPQESAVESLHSGSSLSGTMESEDAATGPPSPLMSPTSAERREEFMTAIRPVSYVMDESGKLEFSASPPENEYRLQSCNMPFNRSPVTLKMPRGGKLQPSSPDGSHYASQGHSPNESFDGAIAAVGHTGPLGSADWDTTSDNKSAPGHFVVVAIDFGTAFSGYAFSFARDPDSIHMMRKWEGGDPGVINQKTPTTLLLTPDGKFHMFGFSARDFYHDLDPQESKKWLYFEKFKMTLHNQADLGKETMIKASNGKFVPALTVFSHALRFFKDHALQELSDQSMTKILNEDVRWIITVPAIWSVKAKQFMRQAAYQAGIASAEYPDQLLIALEPEVASIYCRRLRLHQLVADIPDTLASLTLHRSSQNSDDADISLEAAKGQSSPAGHNSLRREYSVPYNPETVGCSVDVPGTRYMVVDCGGGTMDITVHEIESKMGTLIELHRATGGPYGSVGVDMEFEKLLVNIFGADFIEQFKYKRPAGYVDLMIAFESRKRATCAYKNTPLNISLPFSFIDYYKKLKGSQVESAIRKYGDKEVKWSSQGMLRLSYDAMRQLFLPTLERIKHCIGDVLNNPECKDVKYMFLVGGFAESSILQYEIRKEFGHILKVIIPQDVGLAILKGAVLFGLDPTVVHVRKSRLTYGVGVLNRFIKGKHPKAKLVKRDNMEWCTDVFDRFVLSNQSVSLGDSVLRSYTPAKAGQKMSVISIYCTEKPDVQFITDPGVKKCGTLLLDLSDFAYQPNQDRRREIQIRMIFGDTEIKVMALDVSTGKCVKSAIDFLNQ